LVAIGTLHGICVLCLPFWLDLANQSKEFYDYSMFVLCCDQCRFDR